MVDGRPIKRDDHNDQDRVDCLAQRVDHVSPQAKCGQRALRVKTHNCRDKARVRVVRHSPQKCVLVDVRRREKRWGDLVDKYDELRASM